MGKKWNRVELIGVASFWVLLCVGLVWIEKKQERTKSAFWDQNPTFQKAPQYR